VLEAAAAAELGAFGDADEVRALRAAARAPAPPPPVGEAVEVGGSSWPRKAAMFWRGWEGVCVCVCARVRGLESALCQGLRHWSEPPLLTTKGGVWRECVGVGVWEFGEM
jgi:hypothetical protein